MNPIISEQELLDMLPHGAGIDEEWVIETLDNGNITASNVYHHMSDGYYDYNILFTVSLFRAIKAKLNKLKGTCEGQWQIINLPGDVCCDIKLDSKTVKLIQEYNPEVSEEDMDECPLSGEEIVNETEEYLWDCILESLSNVITPSRTVTLSDEEAKQWLKNT